MHVPFFLWPHRALFSLFTELGSGACSGVAAVAFDGTSSTALLVDEADAAALAVGGAHLALPKLYNEAQVSKCHFLLRHGCASAALLEPCRICAVSRFTCSLVGRVLAKR